MHIDLSEQDCAINAIWTCPCKTMLSNKCNFFSRDKIILTFCTFVLDKAPHFSLYLCKYLIYASACFTQYGSCPVVKILQKRLNSSLLLPGIVLHWHVHMALRIDLHSLIDICSIAGMIYNTFTFSMLLELLSFWMTLHMCIESKKNTTNFTMKGYLSTCLDLQNHINKG